MPKIARIISGILLGILPIIGFGLFGITWYISFPNTIGIILSIIFIILGIYIGLKTFQKVRMVGGIEFLSKSSSSNDFNNLGITKDSTNKRFKVDEYVTLHNNSQNIFKGGCIRIYDDWYGEPYMNWQEIVEMKYSQQSEVLEIKIGNLEKVIVKSPKDVIEDQYFLKILDATEIKIEKEEKGEVIIIEYKKEGNLIHGQSTSKKNRPKFDTNIMEPAFMMYGKY